MSFCTSRDCQYASSYEREPPVVCWAMVTDCGSVAGSSSGPRGSARAMPATKGWGYRRRP
ncbi:hypothetical protein N7U49_04710 [Streptomyces sp. AD2-2]|nr:hypothetical protein N7U49_04710 [Streptomyces sp. AD2-2]